jgi:hypothetical protein
VAPPAENATDAHGAVNVSISLNAQQFAELNGSAFIYYAPPPAFALSPPQGPTEGATEVTLHSGDATLIGPNVTFIPADLGADGDYVCEFGRTRVAATYDGAMDVVRCTSPRAHLALAPVGAEAQPFSGDICLERSGDGSLQLPFDDASAPPGVGVELMGAAAVKEGALRLTDTDAIYNATDGGARLRVTLPRPPMRYLTLSFDLRVTGGLSACAHGFTVSFGNPALPLAPDQSQPVGQAEEPAAESAAADASARGVRVLLGYGADRDAGATNHTVAPYLRVQQSSANGTRTLLDRWLPGLSLLAGGWRPMQLAIHADQLWVWLNHEPLLEALPLAAWRPEADWRVGLHGSRGELFWTQWVDNVHVSSGALRSSAEVPLRLSLNAQQFFATANHSFGYRAPPAISHLSPRAGPLQGGSLVVVSGANLRGGSAYRCRFGQASDVPATHNSTDESLRCIAPAQLASGDALVSVCLNGVQFSGAASFEYFNVSARRVEPARGPVDGATVVEIFGGGGDNLTNFTRGHDRLCAFGGQHVRASVHPAEHSLLCDSPAASEGTVPLRLSLNGQDLCAACDPEPARARVPAVCSGPAAFAAGTHSTTPSSRRRRSRRSTRQQGPRQAARSSRLASTPPASTSTRREARTVSQPLTRCPRRPI